jgi:iron complex transport system permease protein
MAETQPTVDRVAARSASAAALAAVSLLVLVGAAATAFRLSPAEALGFAFAIQGPRLVLAAAVGAALGASAALSRERGRDPIGRELLLFGASGLGVLGGALALGGIAPALRGGAMSIHLGAALASLGALLGAALGAAALYGAYRLPRAAMPLLGVAYPAAWYAGLYGAAYARGTLDAAERARLAWWAGDLSHASWASAGAVFAAVAALIGVSALARAAAHADRRFALEIALLGVAIGAAGPIAFAGSFGAALAWLVARGSSPGTRLWLAALASASGLALVDAVQRAVLGGYAQALHAVTGFIALPVLYIACVRGKQRAEGRRRPLLTAFESLAVAVTSAFGYYVLYRIALVIHGSA